MCGRSTTRSPPHGAERRGARPRTSSPAAVRRDLATADHQAATRVRPGPGVRPIHHHHLPASARHATTAGGVGCRCPAGPGRIAHGDPAALHPGLDPGHLVLGEPVTADPQRGVPQRARPDQVHQARPARRQLDPGRDLQVTARVEGEPHGGQDRPSRSVRAGPTDRPVDGPRDDVPVDARRAGHPGSQVAGPSPGLTRWRAPSPAGCVPRSGPAAPRPAGRRPVPRPAPCPGHPTARPARRCPAGTAGSAAPIQP